MNITLWKMLIAISLTTILSIIGVSVWALDHNYFGLVRISLGILFVLCIVCCGWLVFSITTIFRSLEFTLVSVNELKIGIKEAKDMLREYGICIHPHDK